MTPDGAHKVREARPPGVRPSNIENTLKHFSVGNDWNIFTTTHRSVDFIMVRWVALAPISEDPDFRRQKEVKPTSKITSGSVQQI